jgi:flagellar biosynthesis GTPase FlhF
LDNQTELIVAVDLDATVAAPAVEAESAQTAPAREEDPATFVPFSKLFQSASAFAPLASDEPMPAVRPAASLAASADVLSPAVSAPQQMPLPDLTVQVDAQQLSHEGQRSQEIVELLRLEMAALRKEFSLSRQMMPWQEGLRLSPAIQQLAMAMNEVGMPAGLRALLTDSIQEFETVEQAMPVMQNLLVNALSRPSMAIPQTGVHALCGPSGSGKTSMLGRLAYAAAQVHGVETQVMVSFADQRPGAWAQIQLLAAQSGVECYRATNSDMLRTLLQELDGKTVWIDTSGTDYGAQAELLLAEHPKVLRHAVLPLDATVTSVQTILQNSGLNWSSLMLSKVDEAAYPWALIRGLTDQSLRVSCMAWGNRIDQPAELFDAARLVYLALTPLLSHIPQGALNEHLLRPIPVKSRKPGQATRKPKLISSILNGIARDDVPSAKVNKIKDHDVIEIPILKDKLSAKPVRKKVSKVTAELRVQHG